MDLSDDLHDLVDLWTEVHLAAGAELAQLAHHALQHVGQRQIGDHPVMRVAAEAL